MPNQARNCYAFLKRLQAFSHKRPQYARAIWVRRLGKFCWVMIYIKEWIDMSVGIIYVLKIEYLSRRTIDKMFWQLGTFWKSKSTMSTPASNPGGLSRLRPTQITQPELVMSSSLGHCGNKHVSTYGRLAFQQSPNNGTILQVYVQELGFQSLEVLWLTLNLKQPKYAYLI